MFVKLSCMDEACLCSVKELIDKDFKSRITIRQLEHRFRINENKLRHGFKLLFHISIFDYHTNKRLEYATALFRDRDRSIQEVAYRSGFKDISTFNRSFKRKFGMTPTEYRKSVSNY